MVRPGLVGLFHITNYKSPICIILNSLVLLRVSQNPPKNTVQLLPTKPALLLLPSSHPRVLLLLLVLLLPIGLLAALLALVRHLALRLSGLVARDLRGLALAA